MRGGQASTEYLFLLGMLLVVAIPVWYYTFSHMRDDLRQGELRVVVDRLQATVDEVYLLGSGSQQVIGFSLPSGVTAVKVNNTKEVVLVMDTAIWGDVSSGELALPVLPYVVGKVDTSSGYHAVRVWAMNSSHVNITDVVYQ
ncbi:MAG TPA: hypothetical protein VJB87_00045 [Candidatus Nanoarchaeia archaeon]|nr:hypothetical protein [Candidatus Nanoarchaeia archaeon]